MNGPHHSDVASDAVEPDEPVHRTSPDRSLALQFQPEFGKERDSGLKVVDNDADVVHPQNCHIREHRRWW